MFDFMKLIPSMEKGIADLKSGISSLDESIKKEEEMLVWLNKSACPKEDMYTTIDKVISAGAAQHDAILLFTMQRLLDDPLHPENVHGIGVFTAPAPGESTSFKSIEAVLLGLFETEVKAAMRRRIDAMPWPSEVGPSLAKRPAMIAKVEANLLKLKKDRENFRIMAAKAGISI